jgi:hypothetical protein
LSAHKNASYKPHEIEKERKLPESRRSGKFYKKDSPLSSGWALKLSIYPIPLVSQVEAIFQDKGHPQ